MTDFSQYVSHKCKNSKANISGLKEKLSQPKKRGVQYKREKLFFDIDKNKIVFDGSLCLHYLFIFAKGIGVSKAIANEAGTKQVLKLHVMKTSFSERTQCKKNPFSHSYHLRRYKE